MIGTSSSTTEDSYGGTWLGQALTTIRNLGITAKETKSLQWQALEVDRAAYSRPQAAMTRLGRARNSKAKQLGDEQASDKEKELEEVFHETEDGLTTDDMSRDLEEQKERRKAEEKAESEKEKAAADKDAEEKAAAKAANGANENNYRGESCEAEGRGEGA